MKRKPWTPTELRTLRKLYADTPTAVIAAKLGRTSGAVYQAADKHGLTKSAEYFAGEQAGRLKGERGVACRFKPGHQTWNAGMKGLDIGGKETRFKSGNKPKTWRPIGSERLDTDGIMWRKVADTRNRKTDWKPVHVLIWESVNGPLPRDKFVIFSDGNHSNFEPSNLLAVTRAENMARNTCHRYPKEIVRLMQLRGALNRQINKRERHA